MGIATKNENSAAAGLSSRMASPPMMVAPDRDTPGTSASIWHKPIPSARGSGVRSTSTTRGSRTQAFDKQHDEPADDERAGKHAGALVENRLYVVCEERAGHKRRESWR